MDIGSILVVFALVIIVVGYILQPILEKRAIPITEDNRYTSELQAEHDQILINLQEFDLDHAMGKIPTDDYHRRRNELVARGVTVLKELDRLSGLVFESPANAGEAINQLEQDLDAQIEKEIQERRRSVKEATTSFCSQCGNKVHLGDRFCTKCGYKLSVAEAEA